MISVSSLAIWRAFRFMSLARQYPRFVSRPLYLPLTVFSSSSSPILFCSFSPRRRNHCPPIVTSIRCLRTNKRGRAVLHVSEAKGDARVPGSHLITHFELFLPLENVATFYRVIFNVSDMLCVLLPVKTSTKIMTRWNFSVATVAHKKYDTRRKKLFRLSSRGIRSRVY